MTRPTASFAAPLAPDELLATLDAAVSRPVADEIEVAVLARAGEYTRFAGAVIHQPQDITEVQYWVRAVVAGHAFRAATTVARRLSDAVDLAADSARDRARSAGRPGTTRLADAQPQPADAALWQGDVAAFHSEARVAAALAAIDRADRVGGEVAGMFGRAVMQQAVANSHGLRRAAVATEATGSLTASVADGSSHWIDVSRTLGRLKLERSVDACIRQAAASRGRRDLPPGSYRVVLGAEAVADVLQFLPALGFTGDLAAAGVGLAATRAGEAVAPVGVDIADDALADVGLPIGFDMEGSTKRRVPFLDRGRIGSAVTDCASAAALGTESTGHAHLAREQAPAPEAANIVMSPGADTEAELIAGVERGVYLQRFWYTRLVDRVDGTFTGVTRDACFLIEDGRLTAPVAGMRFTESVLAILAGVEAIGREVRSLPVMNVWNGATSAPPLRVTAFRLGAAPIDQGDR